MNDLDPKVRGLVPKLFRDPKVRGLVPNLPPEHEPEPTGAAEPPEPLQIFASVESIKQRTSCYEDY